MSTSFRNNEGNNFEEVADQFTNESIVDDENQHPTSHNTRPFRRKTKEKLERRKTEENCFDEIVSENEHSTIVNIEEKDENRIWSSMKSAVSCFFVKPDNRSKIDYRMSHDQGPPSMVRPSEPYYSRKIVHRRHGEVVQLISSNETVHQKFPDEVFGNHSSEMFFWPFQISWQVMIMTILMVNFEIICYNVFFDFRYIYMPVENSFSQYMIFWVLQMIYIIDCMLVLVHRQWAEFEIKDTIVSRSRYYVATDLVVLMPTFLCSYLRDQEKFFVHVVQILALHRIVLYTAHIKRCMNISRLLVIYLSFVFIWMFNITLSAFAFGYSCLPTDQEDNWLCGKDYWYKAYETLNYVGKPTTEFELYVLAKLHALLFMPPLREAEYFEDGDPVIMWMYIFMLAVILLYSYLVVVPLLARRIFKNDYLWISFSLMRYKVITGLSDMNFTEISYEKVDQFFSYAWVKRRALLVESVVDDIPPELWLSVHLDIFSPAFSHSLLFANEDHSYLRMLASRMQSILLMEGDVILKKKELAASMIYVVEGSIQILTTEDDTTPQLVLGAGTCFGETTLITSYVSKCYICCHSITCEIHVLNKLDFIDISSRFKKNYKSAVETVKSRYKNAKLLNSLSSTIQEKITKSLRLEEQLITSTDWLKFKMELMSGSKTHLKNENFMISGLEDWYIHANHTLAFLGQLAVPQIGSESVADPVLLKMTFPFIFQPDSRVHQVWSEIIFLAMVFLAFYLPYSFSFSCSFTSFTRFYPDIYLIIYVLDLLLQVSTSVHTKKGMLINISSIFYHRIQQPLFVVDLIATIPLFAFSYVIVEKYRNLRPLLQLNQLLKIYRIEQFLEQKWTIQTESQFFWRKLVKYVVYFAYLIYITTCFIFAEMCGNNYDCLIKEVFIVYQEDRVYQEMQLHELLGIGLYKTSSYYFGTMSLSALVKIQFNELIAYAFIRVLSYFLTLYILSSLISIKAISKEDYFKFNENVKSLLMMTRENAKYHLENYEHSFEYKLYKYAYFLKHDVFLPGMPSSLGLILKSSFFMKVIMEHPIFLEMPRELVMSIANHFQLVTIPVNNVIIKQNHPPKCMFFIIKGVLRAIEDGVEVKKRLRPGDGVGIVEVCFDIPYKRTIVCETDVELIVLDQNRFKHYISNNYQGTEPIKNLMQHYRMMIKRENRKRADINQPAVEFLKEKSVVLENVGGYQPPLQRSSVSQNTPKPNMFRRAMNFMKTNSIFHPHSEFVYKLEYFHAAFAIACFIFYPLQPVLMNCYMPEMKFINLILIGLGALHIYLKCSIAYYHPTLGVLVTSRGEIIKNYLKHSMCLDIFSIIPFDFLPITDSQVLQLLLTYNRFLQIYHFIQGMNYLEKKYKRYQVGLTFIHYIVMLCLVINALSSLVLFSSCELREDINLDSPIFSSCLKCEEKTLMDVVAKSFQSGGSPVFINSARAYMYSAYFVITSIMCYPLQNNLVPHNRIEMMLTSCGPVFGLLVFYLYTTVFVNTILDINHAECQFRMKVERLLQFYKTLEIPDEITRITKSYLSSMWNFNRGLNLLDILEPMNRTSKTDILFHAFINDLLKNKVLNEKAPYVFFDKLFDNMNIRYYSQKCYIILSGDIIGELFFISKGYVHIFDSHKSFVGTVGPGSIFGAMGQVAWSHQRFSFVAATFVETLVISALDIHNKVLLHLPKLVECFTEEKRFDLLVEAKENSISVHHVPKKTHLKREPKSAKSKLHLPSNISSQFHDFSTQHIPQKTAQIILKIWAEIFVFLCTISSSLTIYSMATREDSLVFCFTYYVMDFLKILTVLFRLQKHGPHGKPILPIVRNQKFSILLDIFISLPIDLVFIFIGFESLIIYLLRINRLFALLYVRYHWIKTCRRSMKDIQPNKYSMLIFLVVLLNLGALYITSMTALLYTLWIYQENFIHKEIGPNIFIHQLFLRGIAMITGINSPFNIKNESAFPKTIPMILIHMISKLFSPFLASIFFGYVYVCICQSRFCYPNFLRRSHTFLSFMRNQNVANRFFFKVKATFENNWFKFRDSPVPQLFSSLPYHLQAAVKNHAFGQHIYYNIVFYGCNYEFIRQVVGCLKILWLQPGDKIVKIFSRNGCMYFVIDGIVVMNTSNDVTVDILESSSSFGLAQGIDPNLGHAFNYIAHSNCCIAYLDYNDWCHLGNFYPDSMRMIRNKIAEINMKLEDQFGHG